ncbi:MAG: hypothetical protein QY326_03420 [Bdellovibrionota bacterium]|nr:MAG: hypothetical protein QY326_03420 [Bdellovibrionota bacterium]
MNMQEAFPNSDAPAKGALFFLSESPLCPDSQGLQHGTVRAASVHAALRQAMRSRSESLVNVDPHILGTASHGEGAIVSLSELLPVALPLRTQRGLFCWGTSPGILQLIHAVLSAANLTAPPSVPQIEGSDLLCAPSSFCLDSGCIGLEELRCNAKEDALVVEWADWLARFALPASSALEWWQAKLKRDLVVLSDDLFNSLTRRAQVKIWHGEKSTPSIAFPENCLFMCKVGANAAEWSSISGILQQVKLVRLGSDRATGHGVCRTRWVI